MTTTTGQAPTLLIDFTRRMGGTEAPEFGSPDFDRIGRFAVLQSGTLWFGTHNEQPPVDSRHGYVWALSGNRLYLCPQRPSEGWAQDVTLGVIRELTRRIGIVHGSLEFCVGRL